MQSIFRVNKLDFWVAFSLVTLPFSKGNLAYAQDELETEFDTRAINARGIDPKIAEMFRFAPRFMPGESVVSLSVNGKNRGKVNVRFDEQGKLCVDEKFLSKARLHTPPGFSQDNSCFDLGSAWAQVELKLIPEQEQIELVIPEDLLTHSDRDEQSWERGGAAGVVNYDAQYMDSVGGAGPSGGASFHQLDTEAGFNLSDWIVRSRQVYSSFNGESLLRHEGAYGQRSFSGAKKVLQLGQISLSNSMFGTGRVTGFQVFPETALTDNNGGSGLVEGIAEAQSVVEIRQAGVLLHSTTVPAGPFRVKGFSLLNDRTDLEVTLNANDGTARKFSIPALLLAGSNVQPGLSFGVGKLSPQENNASPLVGTIATGWLLTPRNTLNAGVLAAPQYRAGAMSLDSQLTKLTRFSLQTTLSQDSSHGEKGLSATASLNQNLTDNIAVNLGTSQQTPGYREMGDAMQENATDTKDRNRSQHSASVSWGDKSFGSLSLAWARSSSFNGDSVRYLRGSWGKQFGKAYVNANIEHNTSSGSMPSEQRFYLTLNVPIGGASASSYINTTRRGTRGGLRYSDRIDRDRGWSVYSERDFRSQRTSNSVSADMLTPVSQLNGSISRDSDNLTSWFARASGSAVVHSHGITASSYKIGDTFGIAKIGDHAGVRVETPGGPTWTDGKGYAVLPSLNGYQRSAIEVDTRSLPKNVDIENSLQEIEVSRGAVTQVNFGVVSTRRVLVKVVDAAGNELKQGDSVFDRADNFITIVGEHGRVFIPDASVSDVFAVQTSGRMLCEFTLSLPEKPESTELYEIASAVCR